jgi:hypothetical protein
MAEECPVYRLELEALPGDVPAHVRLRRLLKFALRGCALRCLRAEEMETTGREAIKSEGTDHES